MQSHPSLIMPPLLRGGSTPFTLDTMRRRMPDIVKRVLAENELPQTAVSQLRMLHQELPDGKIQPLPDHMASDLDEWQAAIAPYVGQSWLQVPWFFAETYFYRRIAAVVDHFRSGLDPFRRQKEQSLAESAEQSRQLAAWLNQMIGEGWQVSHFRQLLLADLWGNQADMSMWAAGDAAMPNHASGDEQLSHLVIDDETAVQALLQNPVPQIDLIIDNAGLELMGDLCLADYLLAVGQAEMLRFHLKLFPTFVSDATIVDVEAVVNELRHSADGEFSRLGERLTGYLVNGRLQLTTHPFWTSPYPIWQMPDDLHHRLAAASLIVSKGDANYRRALGDAQWPAATSFAEIVDALPAPGLFLRTCKSEVIAGLALGQAEALAAKDKDWLINGRWGVIQLA